MIGSDSCIVQIAKRIARWAAAIVVIVLGLALSIPGIPGPGLLIALVGVFLLMPESRWLRKKYVALARRYPKLSHPIQTWRARRRRSRRGGG